MPVVYYFPRVLMSSFLLKFFEEPDKLSAVFFLIGEEFDTEVLCDVIDPIAHADNFIVLITREIFCLDYATNRRNKICGIFWGLERCLFRFKSERSGHSTPNFFDAIC